MKRKSAGPEPKKNKPAKKSVKGTNRGRRITPEMWSVLIDSFRHHPGEISRAARSVGVSRPTARKAWLEGFHYMAEGISIKEILAEEQIAARAGAKDAIEAASKEHTEAQAERARQEADKARQDVIRARRQEGEMVRAQRGNLTALIGVTGQVLRGAIKQARELERMIDTGKDIDGRELSVKERIDILWKVNRIVRQSAEATHDVIKMERLLLGEPTEIVGIANLENMTIEQALDDIREAYEAAERVASRRRATSTGMPIIEVPQEKSAVPLRSG